MRRQRFLLFVTLIAGVGSLRGAPAWGAEAFQPLSTGVVFPGFNGAIQLDAAGLALERGSALALQYGVPSTNGSSVYQADYAYAGGSWGLGVGFAAAQGAAPLNEDILFGAAVRVSNVGLGFSMARPMTSSALIPAFDLSLQIGSGNGFQFGADFSGLPSAISTMTLGIGYRESGKYSIEGGVQSPWLTQLFSPGADPVFYLGAGVFPGAFGASMGITAPLSRPSPQFESLGLHWAASSKLRLSARWNSSAPALGGALLTSTSPGVFALGVTLTLG